MGHLVAFLKAVEIWLLQLDPVRLVQSMYSTSPGVGRGANAQAPPENSITSDAQMAGFPLHILSLPSRNIFILRINHQHRNGTEAEPGLQPPDEGVGC